MKSRTIIAAALAATVLLAGCAKKEEVKEEAKEEQAAATPAVDLAAEEQAIRTRSGEWMNYANSKDAASIANGIYSPDAVTIYDGTIRRGSAEIQAGMEESYKEKPKSLISWSSDQVKVASSGDLALETGNITIDPDGEGKKPAVQGAFVTVWAKVDGQWRAIADAGTENAKPAKP